MSMPIAPMGAVQLSGLDEQRHRSLAQTIHRGINLSECRAALDRLVVLGMPREFAAALYAQADALHALLMMENNRATAADLAKRRK